MKRTLFAVTAACVALCSCQNQDEMKLKQLLDNLQAKIQPVRTAAAEAYWLGTTEGDESQFEKYAQENQRLTAITSDKVVFNELKTLKESGNIKDSLLLRQLDIVYNMFLGNQADTKLLNEIIERSSKLEQKYSMFRADYKGKKITDNEVENILRTSTSNGDLQAVWLAHKAIGRVVAQDVVEIVKLRNEVARSLGFENFHKMSLELSGQNPDEISALFTELDDMTRDGFANLKAEMDAILARRFKIKPEEMMPWHYQGRFFQEAPDIYPVDLNKYYKGKNLEQLTIDYFNGMGIDISDVMARSSLYPKEGKNQHAYCTAIDGAGDVRVMCNIVDNETWMGTMLHEFGHAAYAKGHDNPNNPFFLREAAHTFTTEAIAELFGRFSRNPEWMQKMLGLSDEEKASIADACVKSTRLQQLVMSRWVQVVYRFEESMYANPDQDLNALWWTLVEKYQMMTKPEGRNEPDWASKIHIALYPCYYHNYLLGEIFASQMHYYITANIVGSEDYDSECYIGNKEVGKWFVDKIFNVGMRYEWNDMIERATGEKLTAKYYKMQFVD